MNLIPEVILIDAYLITVSALLFHLKLFALKDFLLSLGYLVIFSIFGQETNNWTELLLFLWPFFIYKMYVLIQKLHTWLLPALFLVFQMTAVMIFWSVTLDIPRWIKYRTLTPRTLTLSEAVWVSFFEVVIAFACYFGFRKWNQKKGWARNLLGIKTKFRLISLLCLGILLLFLFFHAEAVRQSNYPLYFFTNIILFLLMLGLFTGISIYNRNIQNEQKLVHLMTSFKEEQKKNEWSAAFRHDYRSWLIGLSEYLRKEDLPAAKQMLAQIIDYSEPLYDENMYLTVTQLSSVPLQGLLFDFYQRCKEEKVIFELKTINDWFFHEVSLIDFLRMLSVILNNALEEVQTLPQEKAPYTITCEFMKKETGYTVLVENPATTKKSIAKIKEKGFSTKKKHSGLGLASLYSTANRYRNIDVMIKSTSEKFGVQLDIFK
jgi:two-component system sensor histidine kinase AgrC